MKSIQINHKLWKFNKKNEKEYSKLTENGLEIDNNSNNKIMLLYSKKIKYNLKAVKSIKIKFYGESNNAGCILCVNNKDIPINSESVIKISKGNCIKLKIIVFAYSKVNIEDFNIEFNEEEISLAKDLDKEKNVLVIVPNYPSYLSLYPCAFAHSRNKEYVKAGLKIQVVAVNDTIKFQTKYEIDDVSVLRCSYEELKYLLAKHQYKTIVTHFVDEKLFPIFDGNVYNNEKLMFICHGPEVVYRYLIDVSRPYFTPKSKYKYECKQFDMRDYYVKKYSSKENVSWIFVSEWLKNYAEEQQGLKFKNSCVINNIIDEELFPYYEKKEEDRLKIVTIRKFENICQHSIDQVILTILELSKKSFFNELQFDIYGDGPYYEELVNPVRQFSNVHLYRTFIPNNQIKDIYKNHGILLLPSRHDAHAVSMGEGASTGLVVVGSNVTSNPYFMNEKENHTLADPEDFKGLADIIERMYNNPKEYLKISKNMSEFTRQFNKENTVKKEIEMIQKNLKSEDKMLTYSYNKNENPILTVAIPSYNVEQYLEKCIYSLINQRNANKMEVLVINDGSKDKTAEIASKYEKITNGVVKLVNKENGGHGSTINTAIKLAKGKYFRLVDGDDWVDSENLAKLIDLMEKSNEDVILTSASYDYTDKAELENIIDYKNLKEGYTYDFDFLIYKNYGFDTYGPLLTTGNYLTSVLREDNFKISEKRPYVDMEFNAFSIKKVKTIKYYNIDIYRYLIGRKGQTISKDAWVKKYADHEYVVFNIVKKLAEDKEYTDAKRMFVYKYIIAQMVDSQIYMLDAICKWDEIDVFLNKLKEEDPKAYDYSMESIKKKNHNSLLILAKYKYKFRGSKTSIIIPKKREKLEDVISRKNGLKKNMKNILRNFTPYGLIMKHRKDYWENN